MNPRDQSRDQAVMAAMDMARRSQMQKSNVGQQGYSGRQMPLPPQFGYSQQPQFGGQQPMPMPPIPQGQPGGFMPLPPPGGAPQGFSGMMPPPPPGGAPGQSFMPPPPIQPGRPSISQPRQSFMADGGMVDEAQEGSEPIHVGPIRAPVAGRTDHVPITVQSNSYVLPADIVSSLGEGNTDAGFEALLRVFPGEDEEAFASGGSVQGVPIAAAGGEFVVSPADVAKLGGGDVERGHKVLDAFVKQQRGKTVKTLNALPGPKKK